MSSTPGIDETADRSDLVREALAVAREAHAGQIRTGSSDGMPFIEHPIAVADRLAKHRHCDEVIAAALLHDVVEKTPVELDELRERFGDRVAELVGAMTEDDSIADYERRKKEHRSRVAQADSAAQAIFAADKLTNVAMLRETFALIGEDGVSEELKVPLDLKIYIWEGDLEMLFDEAPGLVLTDEFADEMVGLWGDRFRAARYQSD